MGNVTRVRGRLVYVCDCGHTQTLSAEEYTEDERVICEECGDASD